MPADLIYKIINKSSRDIPQELYIALLENHCIEEANQVCEDYNLKIREIERTKTEYIFTITDIYKE